MRWLGLLAAAGLVGACSQPSNEPPRPEMPAVSPTEVPSGALEPGEAPPAAVNVVAPPGSEEASVSLAFTSIGPLHQGFFKNSDGLDQLRIGGTNCGAESLPVHISWDEKALTGRIVAELGAHSGRCMPLVSDGVLDLSPIIPAARGLAAYRDVVSGSSDFRIANFLVQLRWNKGYSSCSVTAKGQYPPDGSTFEPCVSVNGNRTCSKKRTPVTSLVLSEDLASIASKCF